MKPFSRSAEALGQIDLVVSNAGLPKLRRPRRGTRTAP